MCNSGENAFMYPCQFQMISDLLYFVVGGFGF